MTYRVRRAPLVLMLPVVVVFACEEASAPSPTPTAASSSSSPPAAAASPKSAPSATTATPPRSPQPNVALLDELAGYLAPLVGQTAAVPDERRSQLDKLAEWIRGRRQAGAPVRLTFICSANSRRSHLGQLWAQVASAYYGLEGVETYSGGTRATAFNPRAIGALERAGFQVKKDDAGGDNPRYAMRFASDAEPVVSFSKKYDDAGNPDEGFAAVMTCSAADKACPIVKGADFRVALPYDDPKVADDTPEEAQRYDERSAQIATEMLYLFSRVDA
ncbi:MAG: protein-tyrosine-phosphatase [Myxococcota bacterium]